MTIGLVTDSNSDIDFNWADEHDIKVVPLNVTYNGEEYLEDKSFDLKSYYRNFEQQDLFVVKTSCPSPGAFLERYEALAEAGNDHIIVIVVSSGLSGTYNSASLAAKNFSEDHNIPIDVIDSRSSSTGTLFLVEKAVELRGAQLPAEDIVGQVTAHRDRISTILSLPTLKYLRASGRISFPKFLLGRIFGLKPIVKVNKEGKNEALATVRNLDQGNQRIYQMTLESMDDRPKRIALVHANAPDRAEQVAEIIRKQQPDVSIRKICTRSTISAHTGPGAVALIAEY